MNRQYLISFPGFVYNCDIPVFDLSPFPESVIEEGKIFALDENKEDTNVFSILISLKEEINDNNYYRNIERIKNLVCLGYMRMPQERYEKIDSPIDVFLKKNSAKNHYFPGVSINSFSPDFEIPKKISIYSKLVDSLSTKDQKKFWQSLQTFCYARQIAQLPNPQYKYTLYLTLYLASINQLADDPKSLHDKPNKLICSGCGVELENSTHSSSHVDEIEKMIRNLLQKNIADERVALVRKLFHPIRSKFIHKGDLSGSEEIGGFLRLLGSEPEIIENDINILLTNKLLLERFLASRFEKKSS